MVCVLVAGFDAMPYDKSLPTACRAPIKLRIGALDPRFELLPAELQSAIQQAGDLWGSAVHRRLFEYDPNAGLPINLVYDERQQATTKNLEAQKRIREFTQQATLTMNELKPLQALLEHSPSDQSRVSLR